MAIRAGTLMGVEGSSEKGLLPPLHTGTQVGLGLRRGKAGLEAEVTGRAGCTGRRWTSWRPRGEELGQLAFSDAYRAPTMCHVRWGNKHPGLVVHRALTFTFTGGPQGWTTSQEFKDGRPCYCLLRWAFREVKTPGNLSPGQPRRRDSRLCKQRERLLEERTSGLQPEGRQRTAWAEGGTTRRTRD